MKRRKWKNIIVYLLIAVLGISNSGFTVFASESKPVIAEESGENILHGPENKDAPSVSGNSVAPQDKEAAETEEAAKTDSKTETESEPGKDGKEENTEPEPADGGEDVFYGEQSLEEMIEILQGGRAPEDFFRYSIWTFLKADDLICLKENGLGLEELFDHLYGNADYSHIVV